MWREREEQRKAEEEQRKREEKDREREIAMKGRENERERAGWMWNSLTSCVMHANHATVHFSLSQPKEFICKIKIYEFS